MKVTTWHPAMPTFMDLVVTWPLCMDTTVWFAWSPMRPSMMAMAMTMSMTLTVNADTPATLVVFRGLPTRSDLFRTLSDPVLANEKRRLPVLRFMQRPPRTPPTTLLKVSAMTVRQLLCRCTIGTLTMKLVMVVTSVVTTRVSIQVRSLPFMTLFTMENVMIFEKVFMSTKLVRFSDSLLETFMMRPSEMVTYIQV